MHDALALTRPTKNPLHHAALQRAIEAASGTSALAKAIGVTPQAISQWDEVPPLRVLAVEAASGIPRHQLRPDIYPQATAGVA